MKTENTLENKARFFAQYYGQFVMMIPDNQDRLRVFDEWILKANQAWVQLTPLLAITDEDALELAQIFNLGHLQGAIRELIVSILSTMDTSSCSSSIGLRNWLNITDLLRSKGYALPWMGLSIEELIEYGWIKLTK